MFILDTNILSAMMRLPVEPKVAAWIAAKPADLLFTTALSQAEILSGLAIMAEGRRRLDLEAAARVMFVEDFMIAAVARSHGAAVVTRDTGGFEGCGLTLINPWETS